MTTMPRHSGPDPMKDSTDSIEAFGRPLAVNSSEPSQWNTLRFAIVALAIYFVIAMSPLLTLVIVVVGGVMNRSRRSVLIVLATVGIIAIHQIALTGRFLPGWP